MAKAQSKKTVKEVKGTVYEGKENGSVVVPINTSITIDKEMIAWVTDFSNGLTAQQIADKHEVNVNTLQAKLIQLRGFLKCNSLPQLVAYFFRNGIIA